MPEPPKAKGRFLLSLALLFLTFSVIGAGYLFATQTGPGGVLPNVPKLLSRDKPREDRTTTVPCPVDGLPASEEAASRRPVAVIIENSPAARPQSGLGSAGFVMEALVEGGVTRFLAVYVHNEPVEVGPVRSARPYFVQVARGFDAFFGHVGGSKEAMAYIRDQDVADVDQFFNAAAYRRDKGRPSPHNVYTGIAELRNAAKARKYTDIGSYEGFRHKDEGSLRTRPASQRVSIDISYPQYRVSYEYDRVENAYARSVGGQADRDKVTGEQLMPKVVIAISVPIGTNRGGTLDMDLVGHGAARIFQDGETIIGNWDKPALESQMTFLDEVGNEIALNRGQIWVHVVRAATPVVSE